MMNNESVLTVRLLKACERTAYTGIAACSLDA
ncbi:MAG: hypothetical protein ACI8S6_001980 [Myxococcota bacterium]|jgi:hypothetical protein